MNLKTSFIALVIFFYLSTLGISQDIIITKKGTEIKSKVLEIGLSDVKYKMSDNLEGPTITILKNAIFMIKFENGTTTVISELEGQQPNYSQSNSGTYSSVSNNGTYRSPGLAVLWSAIYPGIGQFYNGEKKKGFIMAGMYTAGYILIFASPIDYTSYNFTTGTYTYDYTVPVTRKIGWGVMAGTWIWSVIDASAGAKRANARNNLTFEPSINPILFGEGNGLGDAAYGLKIGVRF